MWGDSTEGTEKVRKIFTTSFYISCTKAMTLSVVADNVLIINFPFFHSATDTLFFCVKTETVCMRCVPYIHPVLLITWSQSPDPQLGERLRHSRFVSGRLQLHGPFSCSGHKVQVMAAFFVCRHLTWPTQCILNSWRFTVGFERSREKNQMG